MTKDILGAKVNFEERADQVKLLTKELQTSKDFVNVLKKKIDRLSKTARRKSKIARRKSAIIAPKEVPKEKSV